MVRSLLLFLESNFMKTYFYSFLFCLPILSACSENKTPTLPVESLKQSPHWEIVQKDSSQKNVQVTENTAHSLHVNIEEMDAQSVTISVNTLSNTVTIEQKPSQ